MITAMDEAIGKVTEKLTSLGLDKNTIILFMSDVRGLLLKTRPFRFLRTVAALIKEATIGL